VACDTTLYTPSPYPFHLKTVIIPASGIVLGTILTFTRPGKQFNRKVGDAIQYKDVPTTADDFLQFIPSASIFGLSLAGVKARHDYIDRAVITATAYFTMGVLVYGGKHTFNVLRPDGTKNNSFPSGHTAHAFLGAEIVRQEYGAWYGLGAYGVATLVGLGRVYNNRHWASDVIAGAGVGILSARIGYWLYPYTRRLIRGKQGQITALPYYTGESGGVALSIRF
jgi:membrane-associated phospholipid phosphatase